MLFEETRIAGVYAVEIEPVWDERGCLARTWCSAEFARRGLAPGLAQCSISLNKWRGTLRGMHYQLPPCTEAKLVRCVRGAIYDVVLDIRRRSPTFGQWQAVELSEENFCMLYVPEGVAHGFQTLADNSHVFYQISTPFSREHARGVRWDDPLFAIDWPISDPILSQKDRSYPDFHP